MRKTKFFSVLLVTVMTTTLLANFTACQEPVPGGTNIDFEDLVPEAYGEWDGNYIYRGNVRSKTTGEDAKYLVQNVEIGGISYSVVSCNDYDVVENMMYLTLTVSDTNYSNCLVSYDVNAQEQTLIFHKFKNEVDVSGYYEYEMNYVEQVFENGDILVNGMRRWYGIDGASAPDGVATTSLLFIINQFGTVEEDVDEEYLLYTRISDTYWQKYDYIDGSQKLYVRGWREEPVLVYDWVESAHYTYNITFVEKNGAEGYLIETWRDKKEGEWKDSFIKLEFFDLKQKKLSTLFEGEKYAEWVAVPDKTVLFLYEYDEYAYHTKDSDGTYTAQKDIEIIVLDYSDKGVTAKAQGNHWEDGFTYQIEAFNELTGDAYARVNWMASARGCDSGGSKNEYWEIPVAEGSQKRVLKQEKYDASLESVKNTYYAKNGVTFGDYVYFVRYQRLRNTIIGQARSAYIFQRYSTSADKMDTMQLWMNANYAGEGQKYCQMMWDFNGEVRNEFIISKY